MGYLYGRNPELLSTNNQFRVFCNDVITGANWPNLSASGPEHNFS